MNQAWVDQIFEGSRRSNTAYFFKQWGAVERRGSTVSIKPRAELAMNRLEKALHRGVCRPALLKKTSISRWDKRLQKQARNMVMNLTTDAE